MTILARRTRGARRSRRPRFTPEFLACEPRNLLSTASVSGFVYSDLNASGTFDAADAPAAGELIELTGTDDQGNPVDLYAVTGDDGTFSFPNPDYAPTLSAGTYRLANLEALGQVGGVTAVGSLAPGASASASAGTVAGVDAVSNIKLGDGDSASGYSFGEVDRAIGGRVFVDSQGDGLDPNSDAPMPGVKVDLFQDLNGNGKLDASDGPAIASAVTDASGAYRFLGPGPGSNFIVHEEVPSGYVRTAPVASDDNAVTVCNCGIPHEGVNFANFPKVSTTAITNVSYIINHNGSNTTVTDLRGHVHSGDQVTVKFTVKPGQTSTVSLVSYTAPSASFDASTASQQEVFRDDSGTFGPGTHTLSVTVPNSYFQVDFVAGQALRHLGPAGSNIFYSAQSRLISADNNGSRVAGGSSLSGYVYVDSNRDGRRGYGEKGIAGVTIELTGTDFEGNAVDLTATTCADGSYLFSNLVASDEDGYTLRELPAQAALSSYGDGRDSAGSLGGVVTNDQISDIVLNVNTKGTEYDFGEARSC